MRERKHHKKGKLNTIILLAVGIILMALVLQMEILNMINNRNIAKTSEVLLDRVINVIEKNEDSEEEMISSLKDDYIVRAKAVAYILGAEPEAENDTDELKKSLSLCQWMRSIFLIRQERSTVERFPNITDITSIPASRWHILSQCLRIKAFPCARTVHRTPQKAGR